jgi:hypothetical protein
VKFELITKPQGEVLGQYSNSWDRVEFIMGPLGSGKTIESCQKLFKGMCRQTPNAQGVRPTRWYAIRNTYSDLHTTTIKDWLELFGTLGQFKGGGMEPPTHRLRFQLEDQTIVESELVFIALDRPDAVKKLRGAQVTGFWLNEVKELSKAVVDMADLRHGRYPSMAAGSINPIWHGMIGDTNAPDEDHWYYKLAEEQKPEGWNFHRQPGGLLVAGDSFIPNPSAENVGNLPDGYYIRGMQGKAKDWIKVNLCNEYGFVADGKPVYPEYVDSVHCLTEEYQPIKGMPIILGIDFGRTPACAFVQYNPGFGRYVGFDEFCTSDMSAASFGPALKEKIDREYPGFKFESWGDPAGDQKGQATDATPFKVLRSAGIQAKPTDTNSPLIRRASVINPMKRLAMDGKPCFLISPRCKMWRKGLAGGFKYRRIQVIGDEKFSDEPDKNIYSKVGRLCRWLIHMMALQYQAIIRALRCSNAS